MFGGEIYRVLEDFELKIRKEKSEILFDKPWGAAPTKAHQGINCVTKHGMTSQKKHLNIVSVHQALAPHTFKSARVA